MPLKGRKEQRRTSVSNGFSFSLATMDLELARRVSKDPIAINRSGIMK